MLSAWQREWGWFRPYGWELLVRIGSILVGLYITYGVLLMHLDVVYEWILLSCAEGGWSFVWSDLDVLDSMNGRRAWWLSLYRWLPVRWYHWAGFVSWSCSASEWAVVKLVWLRGLFAWVVGLWLCEWWYVPEMWGDVEDRLEGVNDRVSMPDMSSYVGAWRMWFGVSMLVVHVGLRMDRFLVESVVDTLGWSLLRRRWLRLVMTYVMWGTSVETLEDVVVVMLPMCLVWELSVLRRTRSGVVGAV